MGIVTWTKAHVFHNTDSMTKLALNDSYDIYKVENHIAKKLEKISNCSNHYKAQKLSHYLDILEQLDIKKKETLQISQNKNHSQNTTVNTVSVPASFGSDEAIKHKMLELLRSPENINANISAIKKHITNILSCENYQAALEQGKIRNVVTLLDGLSNAFESTEHKMQCSSFLKDTVADKIFKNYGDRQGALASEQEWDAVKTHLNKIQLWAENIIL